MPETNRGTGRTTLQLKTAPKGALYLWPAAGSITYAVRLARHLRRSDLDIRSISLLNDAAYQLRGRKFPAIILDHAAVLTDEQWRGYNYICTYCIRPDAA